MASEKPKKRHAGSGSTSSSNPFILFGPNEKGLVLRQASTSATALETTEEPVFDNGTVRFKGKMSDYTSMRSLVEDQDESTVEFPSQTAADDSASFESLRTSLRSRLDSDQRERERSTSLRSRRSSDASTLPLSNNAPSGNKLKKRRPISSSTDSQPHVLKSAHAKSLSTSTANTTFSDPPSLMAFQPDQSASLQPDSNIGAVESTIYDQSFSTPDTSFLLKDPEDHHTLETSRNENRTRKPLSLLSRIQYFCSLPLYAPLAFLSRIPIVRLFIPALSERPTFNQVLSLPSKRQAEQEHELDAINGNLLSGNREKSWFQFF